VKARICLVGVGEASAERCLPVYAQDAEITQSEVLEVVGRLPEVEIQQEFDRSCVVERYEAAGAAMLCGKVEWNRGDEEVGGPLTCSAPHSQAGNYREALSISAASSVISL
jgi:hypothetical protein